MEVTYLLRLYGWVHIHFCAMVCVTVHEKRIFLNREMVADAFSTFF